MGAQGSLRVSVDRCLTQSVLGLWLCLRLATCISVDSCDCSMFVCVGGYISGWSWIPPWESVYLCVCLHVYMSTSLCKLVCVGIIKGKCGPLCLCIDE